MRSWCRFGGFVGCGGTGVKFGEEGEVDGEAMAVAMAAAVGRNVVVSIPMTSSSSGWECCVRPGATTLPCSSRRRIHLWRSQSWRISAQPSIRWDARASRSGAVKALSVENDVAVLATKNALQVHNVEKQNSGEEESTPLSQSERLLAEKSQEVSQEMALRGRKGMSIFLIGMMASGKSTVGRVLAGALKYKFSDSDEVVESYEGGLPVKEIFVLKGETEFRDLETRALKSLSKVKRLVVATGGGAVVKDENWKYFTGITVWLDVPVADLGKRVTKVGTEWRPLLGRKCGTIEDAEAELSRLMKVRRPYYAKAHCRVSLEDLRETLELTEVGAPTPVAIAVQVLEEIKKVLQKY